MGYRKTKGRDNETFKAWQSMIYNHGKAPRKDKEVKVCDKWLQYEGFLEDMGIKPENTVLSRLDQYGNFEPGNCKWLDKKAHKAKMALAKNNKSGYIGVSASQGRWKVSVMYNGKRVFLGRFDTPLEAAIIRNKYIIENNLPHTLNHFRDINK